METNSSHPLLTQSSRLGLTPRLITFAACDLDARERAHSSWILMRSVFSSSALDWSQVDRVISWSCDEITTIAEPQVYSTNQLPDHHKPSPPSNDLTTWDWLDWLRVLMWLVRVLSPSRLHAISSTSMVWNEQRRIDLKLKINYRLVIVSIFFVWQKEERESHQAPLRISATATRIHI